MATIYVEGLPLTEPLRGDSVHADGPELIIDLTDYGVVPTDFQDDIVLTIVNERSYDVDIKFRQKYTTNDTDYGNWESIPASLVEKEVTIAPNPAASGFVGFVLYNGDSLWTRCIITTVSANLGIFWTNHNNQTEYT